MTIKHSNHLITGYWFVLPLLWLQLATSSTVFIEPAPYDVIGIGLFILFFSMGLKVPVGIRTGIVLLGAFVIANMVASGLVADPLETYKSLFVRVYMVMSWFLFVCLIYEDPETVLSTIWKGYIVAAVVSVLIGFLAFQGVGSFEQYANYGRVRALFKDPNVYGPFLVPVALYSFSKLEIVNGYKLALYSGLFVFFSIGILLSFSRGSWINFAFSGLLYMGLRFFTCQSPAQLKRLMRVLGLMLMLLLVLIIFVAASDRISGIFELRFQLQTYDLEHGGRFSNQRLILSEVLTYPLGVGANMSEKIFFIAPHNIYLHVLIEAGWFGAIAFYSFLILTLQKGFKFCLQPTTIQNIYTVTYVCIIGILVQSVAIDSTHWRHMYLLLAMLWGPVLFWQDERKKM